jgi:hypothetical protein
VKDRLCGLDARGPGFDFRCYPVSRDIVVLKRSPLGLFRIIKELLERNPTDVIPDYFPDESHIIRSSVGTMSPPMLSSRYHGGRV